MEESRNNSPVAGLNKTKKASEEEAWRSLRKIFQEGIRGGIREAQPMAKETSDDFPREIDDCRSRKNK